MKKIIRPNGYLKAFTIVELLVVIVIIGILAAITIVSYSGISNKAIIASLQSDLNNNSKQLKMYNIEYGYYPSSYSAGFCPLTPTVDSRYCLKYSPGTTLAYSGGNQIFMLRALKNGVSWVITENSAPYAATVPIVDNNTATSITSITATLGATIESDGGADITSAGTCWGLTANPTTNCKANAPGMLTPLSPATIATGRNSRKLIISSDGAFAYALNISTASISMFSRNIGTGLLTSIGSASTGLSAPSGMVFSPDLNFAYAVDYNSMSNTTYASILSRNSSTGILTQIAQPAIGTSISLLAVAISPDGKFVYTAESSNIIRKYSRNADTGLITSLGTQSIAAGANPTYMTFSPDGILYISSVNNDTISSYSYNTSNGSLTSLGDVGSAGMAAFTNDKKSMYVIGNNDPINMYYRALSTDSYSSVGSVAYGKQPYDSVMSNDGASLYVTNYSLATISIYNRNINTGVLTAGSNPSVPAVAGTYAIAISPDDKFVYATDSSVDLISMYGRTKGTELGMFTQARTGLPSGTTIHYRGYAINTVGTGYSIDNTFVTP